MTVNIENARARIRAIILKHKVRQFALREIAATFELSSYRAKVVYYAVVNGCVQMTVEKLLTESDSYAISWVQDVQNASKLVNSL